jgi:hypothetical protein
MKNLLLLFVSIISLNIFAQDVDQIYNDYVNAIGGKAKLAKVKSVQKTITMKTAQVWKFLWILIKVLMVQFILKCQ